MILNGDKRVGIIFLWSGYHQQFLCYQGFSIKNSNGLYKILVLLFFYEGSLFGLDKIYNICGPSFVKMFMVCKYLAVAN